MFYTRTAHMLVQHAQKPTLRSPSTSPSARSIPTSLVRQRLPEKLRRLPCFLQQVRFCSSAITYIYRAVALHAFRPSCSSEGAIALTDPCNSVQRGRRCRSAIHGQASAGGSNPQPVHCRRFHETVLLPRLRHADMRSTRRGILCGMLHGMCTCKEVPANLKQRQLLALGPLT